MNNYSSPRIIRIVNKLDVLLGSLWTILLIFIGNSEEPKDTVVILFVTSIILYCIVGILKICSYVFCIFQGYRVTLIGMILYIIWISGISISVAVVLVQSLIEILQSSI